MNNILFIKICIYNCRIFIVWSEWLGFRGIIMFNNFKSTHEQTGRSPNKTKKILVVIRNNKRFWNTVIFGKSTRISSIFDFHNNKNPRIMYFLCFILFLNNCVPYFRFKKSHLFLYTTLYSLPTTIIEGIHHYEKPKLLLHIYKKKFLNASFIQIVWPNTSYNKYSY